MQKIAFIVNSPYTLGGMQRVVTSLANSLNPYNYDITILSVDIDKELEKKNIYNLNSKIKVKLIKKYGVLRGFLPRITRRINRYTGFLNFNLFEKIFCKIYFPNELRKNIINEINNEGYNYVIALGGYYSILLGSIKKKLSCICIGWEHSSFDAYFNTKFKYHYNEHILFKTETAKLDKIVVLTDLDVKKYADNFNIYTKRIYNPLTSFNTNDITKLNNNIIISISRIDIENKGLDLLLEIFDKVKIKIPDAKLRIVGDGKDFSKFKELVSKRNYKQDIELLGKSDKVGELLIDSSVFVSTSRWEGFGLVITEALSCGVPTVCFENDGPNEIINKRNINGFIISKYNIDDFSKKVINLLKDKKFAKKIQKESIIRAQDFNSDKIANEWICLFSKLSKK